MFLVTLKRRRLKWCAVALHNRRTIFCGGYDANNQPSNQVIMFNMDKFEEIAPMVRPRARAAATVYHEGNSDNVVENAYRCLKF